MARQSLTGVEVREPEPLEQNGIPKAKVDVEESLVNQGATANDKPKARIALSLGEI